MNTAGRSPATEHIIEPFEEKMMKLTKYTCCMCKKTFASDREVRKHLCLKSEAKKAREQTRSTGHYGFDRDWRRY
jgi:hypothetical protein